MGCPIHIVQDTHGERILLPKFNPGTRNASHRVTHLNDPTNASDNEENDGWSSNTSGSDESDSDDVEHPIRTYLNLSRSNLYSTAPISSMGAGPSPDTSSRIAGALEDIIMNQLRPRAFETFGMQGVALTAQQRLTQGNIMSAMDRLRQTIMQPSQTLVSDNTPVSGPRLFGNVGQLRGAEIAAAMDRLRRHLRSNNTQSLNDDEVQRRAAPHVFSQQVASEQREIRRPRLSRQVEPRTIVIVGSRNDIAVNAVNAASPREQLEAARTTRRLRLNRALESSHQETHLTRWNGSNEANAPFRNHGLQQQAYAIATEPIIGTITPHIVANHDLFRQSPNIDLTGQAFALNAADSTGGQRRDELLVFADDIDPVNE